MKQGDDNVSFARSNVRQFKTFTNFDYRVGLVKCLSFLLLLLNIYDSCYFYDFSPVHQFLINSFRSQ